jgi:hypothetical protein
MRHQIKFVFGLLTLAVAQSLRAEIILDDFDDPAEVISPEMEGDFVVTNNVGPLNATRTFLIFGQSDPVAQLDSNLTTPSRLTGALIDFAQPNSTGALMRFGFSYQFSEPVDLTEQGLNNAFLLDFSSLETFGPVTLTVFVAAQINLNSASVDFLTYDLPDSVVVSFKDFAPRGGGPLIDDFRAVSAVYFRLFARDIGNEIATHFQIDRIRIGPVPEASMNSLTIIALATLTTWRQVWRQTLTHRR